MTGDVGRALVNLELTAAAVVRRRPDCRTRRDLKAALDRLAAARRGASNEAAEMNTVVEPRLPYRDD